MCCLGTRRRSPICAETSPMPVEVLPPALSAAHRSMLALRSNHRPSVSAIMCLELSWLAKVARPGLHRPPPLPRSNSNLTKWLRARLPFKDLLLLPHRRLSSSSRHSSSIPRVPAPTASRRSLRSQRLLLALVRGAASDVHRRAALRLLRSTLPCLILARDSRRRSQRTRLRTTLACSSIPRRRPSPSRATL